MTTASKNPLGPGFDVPGREERYRDSFQRTLRDELNHDENVYIMGEDVAGGPGREDQGIIDSWGGPFAATKGLIQDFGARRIVDTPISEAGFLGAAIGSALTGLRPVVDLMYFDFIGVAMDQIISNASKSRYMFGGQTRIPLTMFARSGGGTGHAAQHSSNFYSILAHLPGIKVVVPSDPYSVRGLLAASIRDDDPVIIFNNRQLMGLRFDDHVPEASYTVPIGKANIAREGTDVTLIGIGYTTRVCLEAADDLAEQGYAPEVIDLLSLSPMDREMILASVRKTRKVVIVDEDRALAQLRV